MAEPTGWVARVTPPGGGAVVLLHVGGATGFAAVAALVADGRGLPPPGRARHAWLAAGGERLDDVVLVHVPAGASYTGAPFLEIGLHGGPAVVAAVTRALARRGVRPLPVEALWERAWEPLRRAAFRALRRAESRAAVAALAAVLGGGMAAVLEAAARDPRALAALRRASRRLRRRLRTLRVFLLGPPNAGKSSLGNALSGRPVATVSPEPGTTRDPVTVDLLLGDHPVRLVDTDGRLPPERVRPVTVRLWVADARRLVPPPEGGSDVRAANKVDLLGPRGEVPRGWLPVSARTGAGLPALVRALLRAGGRVPAAGEPPGPAYWTRKDLALLAAAARGEGGAWEELRRRTLPRGGEPLG